MLQTLDKPQSAEEQSRQAEIWKFHKTKVYMENWRQELNFPGAARLRELMDLAIEEAERCRKALTDIRTCEICGETLTEETRSDKYEDGCRNCDHIKYEPIGA